MYKMTISFIPLLFLVTDNFLAILPLIWPKWRLQSASKPTYLSPQMAMWVTVLKNGGSQEMPSSHLCSQWLWKSTVTMVTQWQRWRKVSQALGHPESIALLNSSLLHPWWKTSLKAPHHSPDPQLRGGVTDCWVSFSVRHHPHASIVQISQPPAHSIPTILLNS